jgi:IMP dehydrogenase
MDFETMKRIIIHIKSANIQYDTPITVKPTHTIRDALGLMYKRAHRCVVLVDDNDKALGVLKPKDLN